MRICFITTDYPPSIGGMGLSVRRIARGLNTHTDHEIHILWLDNVWILAEPSGRNRLEPDSGLPQSPRVHQRRLAHWEYDNVNRAYYDRLQRLHRKVGFDIFVAFGVSYSGFPVILLGKELHIPTIVSMHGADLNLDAFRNGRFSHIRWSLVNATQVVSVSGAELRMANAATNLGGRGLVIPNHVAPEEFEQGVTAAVTLDHSSIVIAMAANFGHIKGLHVLLEAASKVPGLRFTLLLIGDAGYLEKEYFQTQRNLYRDRLMIVETGLVPHWRILSYMHLADIFVLPSLSEGAPNVLLEAMLASVAIVASDVGAVREMIEDDVTGLIVGPGSVEDLADALTRLGHDRELRRRLAGAAHVTATTRFSTEQEVAAWDAVLHSVAHAERK